MTMEYFERLTQSLQAQNRALPTLLIDLDKLDQNIAAVLANFPKQKGLRWVVKSLPSPELLHYIMKRSQTERLMVFHQPFLTALVPLLSETADVLLGKPMPVTTAEYFYTNLPETATFNAVSQVQWLIDTEERLIAYANLAEKLGQKLRVSLEIDIGLHRGGFSFKALFSALHTLQSYQHCLEFSGFMGYDPHVVKLPKILRSASKAFSMANTEYKRCIDLVTSQFPELCSSELVFNGGGSPTLELHKTGHTVLNEIAVGSCILKPSTFDIPSLTAYQPACFIATPILKKLNGTRIPAIEFLSGLMGFLKKKLGRSYFIYGGYWKANYCYPPDATENGLFGASTNQSLVNTTSDLAVGDYVFLRPSQSEFVLLQFGQLQPVRNQVLQAPWNLLKNY